MASQAQAQLQVQLQAQPQRTALDDLRVKLTTNAKPNGKGEMSQFSARELEALVECIASAIEKLQPPPQYVFDEIEFEKNPEAYPPFRGKVIVKIKAELSPENQLLPILEEFNFQRWSGMFRNLDRHIDSMVQHVAELLEFDGFCFSQGHFYR